MKTGTLIIIIAWLCVCNARAQQKIEKNISFSGKDAVELNIRIADSIHIQTWNKNEVYVSATVNINENKDNEAYLTSFAETDNKITVDANFREDYFRGMNNNIKSDIYWQVYIPENAFFSVESINADIIISGKTDKMNVKTISGYIDLAVPERQPANLEFSTITGTVYTNHTLALEGDHRMSHPVIKEKFNNGGSLIKLETISGDIFFRKSKL